MLPESDNWTAWLDILAAMEADLAEFDRGLTFSGVSSIVPEWKIPQNVGPIPENLVDRADRTLRAQRDAIRRVQDLQRETASHLTALRSVPSAVRTGQPVYLDVAG